MDNYGLGVASDSELQESSSDEENSEYTRPDYASGVIGESDHHSDLNLARKLYGRLAPGSPNSTPSRRRSHAGRSINRQFYETTVTTSSSELRALQSAGRERLAPEALDLPFLDSQGPSGSVISKSIASPPATPQVGIAQSTSEMNFPGAEAVVGDIGPLPAKKTTVPLSSTAQPSGLLTSLFNWRTKILSPSTTAETTITADAIVPSGSVINDVVRVERYDGSALGPLAVGALDDASIEAEEGSFNAEIKNQIDFMEGVSIEAIKYLPIIQKTAIENIGCSIYEMPVLPQVITLDGEFNVRTNLKCLKGFRFSYLRQQNRGSRGPSYVLPRH